MPTARSAGAAGVYGGRIYVTGGEYQDYRMMATLRSFEAYDPMTNTWQTTSVATGNLAMGSPEVSSHRLHMVSGDVQSAAPACTSTPSRTTLTSLTAARNNRLD